MHWSIFLLALWFSATRMTFGAVAYPTRTWLKADGWASVWILGLEAAVAYFIPSLKVAGWVGAGVFCAMPILLRCACWHPTKNARPLGGIIDVVWSGVIIGIAAILMLAQVAPRSLLSNIPVSPRPEFLRSSLEEARFLLSTAVQCLLALGAVLGVCMTILWKNDVWNANPNPEIYNRHLRGAAGMVIAFGGCGLGVLIWFLLPVYDSMERIRMLFASI